MKFKYFSLFAFVLLLLTAINVSALPDFTDGNLYSIGTGTNDTTHIRAYWLNDEWWIGYATNYTDVTNTLGFNIGVYDEDFVNQHAYTIHTNTINAGVQNDETTSCGSAINLNTTFCDFTNISNSEILATCHITTNGTQCSAYHIYNIYSANNTKISRLSEVQIRPDYTGISNTPDAPYNITVYTTENGTVFWHNRTSGTNQGLTLPDGITTPEIIHFGSITIDGNNRYLLFVQSSESEIDAVIYDADMDYLATQSVSTSGDIEPIANPSVAYADVWYLAYRTNESIRITALDFNYQANLLYEVDTTTVLLGTPGTNYTDSPFISVKDNLFYLFYSVRSTTDNHTIGMYAQEENITCTCTDWVNASCVDDEYRKQVRSCTPARICDNTTFYIKDSTCSGLGTEQTFIRTEDMTADNCTTDWALPGATVGCDLQIELPDNCFNITVYETTRIDFFTTYACAEWWGYGNPLGTYTWWACVPYGACNTEAGSCYNTTSPFIYEVKNYTGYSAGQLASGQARGRINEDCACKEKFKVTGYLGYECYEECSNKWVCKDHNTRAYLNSNCSYTEEEACDYGCNEGACLELPSGDIGGEQYSDYLSGTLDWFWAFTPDATSRAFLWLIITLMGTLVVMFKTDGEHQIQAGIVTALLLIGIGFIINALPLVLIFLLAIPVILILANKLGALGGGG